MNAMTGLATRIGTDGKRVLFTTRIQSQTAPATTIGTAEVYQGDAGGPEGTIFEVNESSTRNRVTVRQKRFVPWAGNGTQPFDNIEAQPDDVEVDYVDAAGVNHATTYGVHEQVYEIEGNLQTAATTSSR